MGLFGHGGLLSKANHGIGDLTYSVFGKNIVTGKERDGGYGAYVGYGTESGLSLSTPYFGPNAQKLYNYGNVGTSNTTAYKANVAGTANKIAQGGMTKDELIQYNMKHPNEIAGDPAIQTTSLNSNTAVRS